MNQNEQHNYCLQCGIDIGDCNPRQLCGKTHCLFADSDYIFHKNNDENDDENENENNGITPCGNNKQPLPFLDENSKK